MRVGLVRRLLTGAVVLPWLLLAGCAASGEEYTITLEVQDGWVREPGAECAGSIPYLYVHRTGPFRVLDASGEEAAAGELPGGTAVDAYNEDLGVPRVPTFCRFRIPVRLPAPGSYRLALEEGDPRPFEAGDGPILVVIP